MSYLAGQASEVHDGETALTVWELFGLRVIRQAKWKTVYITGAPRPGGLGAL